MKFITILSLVFTFFLVSCGNPIPASILSPETTLTVLPLATLTLLPSSAPLPSPTAVPFEALSAEGQVQQYLAGEIEDINTLNDEQQVRFSEVYTALLNEQRGINPAVYNNEAYIDPTTGRLMNYDRRPGKSETIEMYWSYAGRDEHGNVKVRRGNKTITIQNSAGIENWEEIYTDSNDTRIEWPTNILAGKNISPAQILMGSERPNPVVLRMAVPIGETIGEVYVEGYGKASGLRVMILEDDGAGNIIFGREMIVVGSPVIRLYEGGKNTESITAGAMIDNYSDFWRNLEQYATHYMAIPKDQNSVYNRGYNGSLENYSGLIHGQVAFDVVNGKSSNDKDLLLLAIAYLMKR